LCHSFWLLDRFRFCETRFTTYQRFVADQSVISPFLGGDWRWLGTCTPFICHLVYTVSLVDTVEKCEQKQWNCIEWLIKGGPVPSILDDLCLSNVLSKYFCKLRVGTSKIQPELKYLENILLSFYESLLRARLWEHELFSVRSIAFISTLVKSPDEACIKYKAFYTRYSRECHISGLVSTSLSLAHNSLVSEPDCGTGKSWEEHYMHNVYFYTMIACVLKVESIFKTHHF